MSYDIISLSDRIKELSYSTGTGDFSLDGAVAGFSSFGDVYQNNDALFYAITDGSRYEIGSGQYIVVGGNDYLRRYPFRSTSSNGLVNFIAGAKEVYVTYPGNYSVFTASGLGNFQRPQSSGVAFWRSAQILDYDSSFIWDATNNRLGINMPNPVSALHIGGTTNQSILTVSGVVLGASGVWFNTPTYTGGVQLEPFMRNQLDATTGTDDVFELSGIVSQALLFKKQNAGTVFAGPITGCESPPCTPDYPTFRALTSGDIPPLGYLASEGSCAEGNIPFCNGAGKVVFDSYLTWNSGNNYLGVNNNNPSYSLDIGGNGRITGDLILGDAIIFSDNSTISGAYLAGSGLSLHGGRTFNIGNLFQLSDDATSGWIHQGDVVTVTGINGVVTSYNPSLKKLTINGAGLYDSWTISDQFLSSGTVLANETVYFSGISGIVAEYNNSSKLLKISAGILSGVLSQNIIAVSGWNKQYTDITSGNLHNEIVEVSGWNKQYTDITSGNLYNHIVNVSGWNKQYTDITSGNLYNYIYSVSGWNKQYTDITSGNLHSEIVSVSGWNKQYTDIASGNLHNEIVEVSGYFENKPPYAVGSGLTVVNKTLHTAGTGNFSQIVFGPISGNINLGTWSGTNDNNNYKIGIGYEAGKLEVSKQDTSKYIVGIGYRAGGRTYNNDKSIYIGYNAGYNGSGNNNIFIGPSAGYVNEGYGNIEIIAEGNSVLPGISNRLLNIAHVIQGDLDLGRISIGPSSRNSYACGSTFTVRTPSGTVGLSIQADSTQLYNLQEWQNSANKTPTWVNNSGILNANSGIIYSQGIPLTTTNTVYNSGGNLYWDQCKILTECTYEKVYRHTSNSNYNVSITDQNIIVELTNPPAPITLDLPRINGIAGKRITVKRYYVSANGVVLTAATSPQETIDGLNTYTLSSTAQSVTLLSDGTTNWKIISGL